jgi:cytochrome P450
MSFGDSGGERAFKSVSTTYDAAGLLDPYPLYAELRRSDPVMKGDILARFGVPSQADYGNLGRTVFSVFRYDDVMAVLRDDATWTSDLLMDGLGTFLGDMLLSARDGERHHRLRALLTPCFAPSVLKRWKDQLILPLVEAEYGARMRPRGHAELIAELALPFPVRAIYAILGFPEDPGSVDRFADWALRILAGPQIDPEKAALSMPAAFKASQDLYDHVRAIVAERRRSSSPGDDLIGHLSQAEQDGMRLDDGQIADIVRMLLPAAAETTTRTLGNLMVMLFQHPDILDRVRADRSLLPRALNESMRLDPVAGFLARKASREVVLSGVTIPKDAAASLVISSANRDGTVFEEPDRFNIDRPLRSAASFGYGVHMCIGMAVARLEIEAAVNMLLDLPGLRLDPDFPPPQIRGMQFRGAEAIHIRWDVLQ